MDELGVLMTFAGGGEPPVWMCTTLPNFLRCSAGAEVSIVSTVGAPHMWVTPCSTISFDNAATVPAMSGCTRSTAACICGHRCTEPMAMRQAMPVTFQVTESKTKNSGSGPKKAVSAMPVDLR